MLMSMGRFRVIYRITGMAVSMQVGWTFIMLVHMKVNSLFRHSYKQVSTEHYEHYADNRFKTGSH